MDQNLWDAIENLFDQAIQLPTAERAEFIEKKTANQPVLRAEVESLLKHHDADTRLVPAITDPSHFQDAIEKVVSKFETDHTFDQDNRSRSHSTPTKEERLIREQELIARLEATESGFQVHGVINHGGMGTVLQVHDKSLQRVVAVKILHATVIDDEIRSRFVRESRATAKVHCDNVVEIFSVHDDAVSPFLVMEHVDGPNLREVIDTQTRLAPRTASEIARQVALGLAASHELNLVHRDVKPGNIMLEKFDPKNEDSAAHVKIRAKLIDFGIARDLSDTTKKSQDQFSAGTPAYMAPEQILAPETVDHRSDVYGLGATLYQMLVGEQPFRGSPHMILKKIDTIDPVPPRQLDDRIPKDLESICLKALNRDPRKRYQSALEMADDLQRFLDGLPTIARPVTRFERFRKWCFRNPRLALAASLACSFFFLLTVGATIFAWTVSMKNKEINQQRMKTVESRVASVVQSEPGALPLIIQSMLPMLDEEIEQLTEQFQSPNVGVNGKFHSAIALSFSQPEKAQFIVDNVGRLFESSDVCMNAIMGLKNNPRSIELLRASLQAPLEVDERAKRIVLLAHLNDWEHWIKASELTSNPELRTHIIHMFPNWHGQLPDVLSEIRKHKTQPWLWTFCQALAMLDHRSLTQLAFEDSNEFLTDLYLHSPHYSVRASAEAALKKRDFNFEQILAEATSQSNKFVNLENGIRLVRIKPGTALIGRIHSFREFPGFPPRQVTISREFFISDTEITNQQFREFLNDTNRSNDVSNMPAISPGDEQFPVRGLNWFEAVRFCNWLSRKHGLEPAYVLNETPLKLALNSGGFYETEHWMFQPDSSGYRLPTESEWEFACRAYSETQFHFGNDADLLKHYGNVSHHRSDLPVPVKSHLPNANGLFDMHGNVWEWCHDWSAPATEDVLIDPRGPKMPSPEANYGKVYRGGGINTFTGIIDGDARGETRPESEFSNVGFRIARSIH